MTKPLSADEKAKREEEREAAKKGNPASTKGAVTIDTAIEEIEGQLQDYIGNVGASVFSQMAAEVRKMAKEGVFEDKVDGQIALRLSKEGLKLTLVAKTQVVVKEVHKDEFSAIVSNPQQPELPMNGNGDGKKLEVISGGEVAPKDAEPTEPVDGDATGEEEGVYK